MARKQRTWNYGNLTKKRKKRKNVFVPTDYVPLTLEDYEQIARGEYFTDSPLNYMARIGSDYRGADYRIERPRIVQSSTDFPGEHGSYYPKTNRQFETPQNLVEAELFRKIKSIPGASVTDTERMAGRSSKAFFKKYYNPRTYGKEDYAKPFRPEEEGTGYKATSRPKDVIGLDPHNPYAGDTSYRVGIGYQPRSYGGLQSYESEYYKGRGYLGDSKQIHRPQSIEEQHGYRSVISQLDTLDHELQHRGFAKWKEIVYRRGLWERLEKKYGKKHPVLRALLYDEHPYIYYQSTDPRSKKHRGKITRQVKEMVDQEILPYFFKEIPSLKEASSLQGPAYGDVKGRGTTMKKRKYQTKKKRGTASYAVKTRGKYVDDDKNYRSRDRVYKGSWNY